jgi:hypothetical protein
VAYLAPRRLDERTWQFGAHGLGPDADTLTARMLDAVAVWDRHLRHGPDPQYTVHPAGTEPASGGPADDDGRTRLAVRRRHTTDCGHLAGHRRGRVVTTAPTRPSAATTTGRSRSRSPPNRCASGIY